MGNSGSYLFEGLGPKSLIWGKLISSGMRPRIKKKTSFIFWPFFKKKWSTSISSISFFQFIIFHIYVERFSARDSENYIPDTLGSVRWEKTILYGLQFKLLLLTNVYYHISESCYVSLFSICLGEFEENPVCPISLNIYVIKNKPPKINLNVIFKCIFSQKAYFWKKCIAL